MFGWLDRAAGHIRLPARLARPAASNEPAATPAPRVEPDSGGRRRASLSGVGLGLLLLVLAPLTALTLKSADGSGQDDASGATGPSTVINVPPPSPEQLMPQSTKKVPAPSPANSIELSATVQSDGTAAVTETLTLSPQSPSLVLAVPATATPPGSAPTQADAPQALSIAATVNGKVVGSPTRVGVTPVSVALPAGTNHIVLRYLLVGSTVRSTPSTAGRALTSIAPIAATSQPGLGLIIHVRGSDAAIRNLVCPAAAGVDALCATQANGRWRTTTALTAATGFGLAQVDLPR